MIVVMTRMRPRRWWFILPFAWGSARSMVQAWRTRGFLGGRAGVDPFGLEFWTVTVWADAAALRGFRDAGIHARLMPRLAGWAQDATFATWWSDGRPTWAEANARLAAQGTYPQLDHPSQEHGRRVLAGRTRRRGVWVPIPRHWRTSHRVAGPSIAP